jgi:hypothetical protein
MRDYYLTSAMCTIAYWYEKFGKDLEHEKRLITLDREGYMDSTKSQSSRDAHLANALARLTAFGL